MPRRDAYRYLYVIPEDKKRPRRGGRLLLNERLLARSRCAPAFGRPYPFDDPLPPRRIRQRSSIGIRIRTLGIIPHRIWTRDRFPLCIVRNTWPISVALTSEICCAYTCLLSSSFPFSRSSYSELLKWLERCDSQCESNVADDSVTATFRLRRKYAKIADEQ